MAARFWRLVLFGELMLAASIAALVSMMLPVSLAGTCAVGLAAFVCAPGIFVGLARAAVRPAERVRTAWDCGHALRALLWECVAFNLAACDMSLPGRAPGNVAEPADDSSPPRPVLLIHGIVCNGAVWNPLRKRLSRAGFAPIRAINLEPMFGDLDAYATTVVGELVAMQQRAQGARVTIIAHSMGGVVARAALRSVGAEVIDRIVTVASPHHGTSIARYLRVAPLQQLRPGCAWLRALNEVQEGAFAVPLTSIYSLEDELVTPPRSAALQGAELRELRGVGHLGMLRGRRSLERIMEALRLP